jgi:hypothetical protein
VSGPKANEKELFLPEPELALRLSPSGPIVANAGGGPFEPGPGARLRMTEYGNVIGDGSEPLPTLAAAVSSSGFTGAALVLSLPAPKPTLYYRAEVHAALICNTTLATADAQFFLDYSIDGGTNWVNAASNTHKVMNNVPGGEVYAQLIATKVTGASLGITPTTAELLLRVRMASTLNPQVELFGLPTPAPGAANSKGSFHFQLEKSCSSRDSVSVAARAASRRARRELNRVEQCCFRV